MPSQILSCILLSLSLISIQGIPTFDTTDIQMSNVETSTTSKQIFDDTTVDQLIENKTTSEFNGRTVTLVTTTMSIISNSTAANVVIAGKGVTARVIYYYNTTTTQSNSDSGPSAGTIVGIIFGIIALICCLSICGCCTKGGHWETVRVYVRD